MHRRADVEIQTPPLRVAIPLQPRVGDRTALEDEQKGEDDGLDKREDEQRVGDARERPGREEADVEEEEGHLGQAHGRHVDDAADEEDPVGGRGVGEREAPDVASKAESSCERVADRVADHQERNDPDGDIRPAPVACDGKGHDVHADEEEGEAHRGESDGRADGAAVAVAEVAG